MTTIKNDIIKRKVALNTIEKMYKACAVTMFADYGRTAEWIRSQVLSEMGREIKEQCGIG